MTDGGREPAPSEESPVLVSVRDGVAWITLNRPARLNALNRPLMFSLLAQLEAAMADASVRVLVMTGAGRAFCAGGDVHNLDEVTGDGPMPERAARLRQVARITEILYDGPKPTIAAINGACAGAGLSIAAAADFRIAAAGAVFTTAFLAVGVSGDMGSPWTLARILGPARARRLFLECERFDAQQALAMGLVDGVVPQGDLEAEAARRAARIAAWSPSAVAAVRANFRDAVMTDFGTFLDRESLRQVQTQSTPESRQAVERFLARDKRG
jgi:2-(1,2-epoxy-1,2-dihydrophenyl)acetyl-CoA isomerase